MLRTLAAKHRCSVNKIAARHKAEISTPHGLRTRFEATVNRPDRTPLVARFGGIPLTRKKDAVLFDRIPNPAPRGLRQVAQRLSRDECELCQGRDNISVHQIRWLADLAGVDHTLRPDWMNVMLKRRRKTLVVCGPCHDTIHTRASSS